MMPHPKILTMSADLSIGHPLTRDVGGTWVSRVTILAEDIASQHPDLILLQRARGFDWMAWGLSDPRLKAALAAYRPARTVGDGVILQRRAALAPPPPQEHSTTDPLAEIARPGQSGAVDVLTPLENLP
jgi:hypothetical protein